MPFAARIQASSARLKAHFGDVSVVIRQGVGATTMTVTSRPPIDHSLLSDTGSVGDLVLKIDGNDPGLDFTPLVGYRAAFNSETYMIKEVTTHRADAIVSYRLVVGGTK